MIILVCIKQHLSNIWSSIHEKLKQHWGCLEKKKKSVYFVVSYNESLFPPFFVLLCICSCFCVNREKISFPGPDFVDSETLIWGLTSLTDFYKRVHLLFKKTTCVRLSKENLFCSKNAPEIHIFNSLRHQKLLLVAN